MSLPSSIGVQAFDALHDDPAAWRGEIEALARALGAEDRAGDITQALDGTALVALIGRERVLKLYPPFLRDHFEFERAMLGRLHGRLAVPTPRLLASGNHGAWPYLVMTQLEGEPLTATWPAMPEAARLELLRAVGRLAAQAHALPVGEVAALAPPWDDFIARQRAGCVERQRRTGLPAHLLAQVPAFIEGPLPAGPAVLLTGEYTPMNLLTQGHRLAAMYDFGDGLVGPREYDWLGPLSFLAAGHAARCAAFLDGYGVTLDDTQRESLLRLLLLHRYSNLKAQLALDGWRDSASLEALARRAWPTGA